MARVGALRWGRGGLAGAVGVDGAAGSRTWAVLLVALRAPAPTERAVRSAERANMVMAPSRRGGEGGQLGCWLGCRGGAGGPPG